MKATRTLADRLYSRLLLTETGCLEYLGARLLKGYGRIGLEGGAGGALTHRVAWELANGPIPEGMLVCHRCDNPPCCNPDHLFLGTHADNNRDTRSKGHHGMSRKTHCVRGHAFVGDNVRISPGGARICRACDQERNVRRRANSVTRDA